MFVCANTSRFQIYAYKVVKNIVLTENVSPTRKITYRNTIPILDHITIFVTLNMAVMYGIFTCIFACYTVLLASGEVQYFNINISYIFINLILFVYSVIL